MKARRIGTLFIGCAVALLAIIVIKSHHDRTRSFAGPPLVDIKAEDLGATGVSAVMDVPIAAGTNVLWCGTFQLAWNEAMELFGEDVRFAEDAPLAATLNRKEFAKQDLDADSYFVAAAPSTPRTVARIGAALRHRFGVDFDLKLPASTNDGFLFYSCLVKNLPFENRFDRLRTPLRFGTNDVAAFGIDHDTENQWMVRNQVWVTDYRDTNDFIIELRTRSKEDNLILAKIPPQPTLAGTVQVVRKRVAESSGEHTEFGRLAVPITDFSVTRLYDELIGKHLALVKSTKRNGNYIGDARQLIRFRLDERGATLKSETIVSINSVPPAEPPDLVFDQPYLILLQRAGASSPYFALWVDNAELLASWKP